jgi:hypothetical protein
MPRIANTTTKPDKDEKIEITPEMIKAGMLEYSSRWCGLRDADDDVARVMVAEVSRSMYRLRPLKSYDATLQTPLHEG